MLSQRREALLLEQRARAQRHATLQARRGDTQGAIARSVSLNDTVVAISRLSVATGGIANDDDLSELLMGHS